ncbi:MAG: copper homeostasis protein CutC [Pseudomonadota bacterium]
MGEAVEAAVSLGFRRVLTSDGATGAGAGTGWIAALAARAAGPIAVMPGSGVTQATAALLKGLGITQFHASCSASTPVGGRWVGPGHAPAIRRQTAADLVPALRQALA